MIIGSAGDCGSGVMVDRYIGHIKEFASKHKLPKFKIAYFYSDLTGDYLKKLLKAGKDIIGLDGRKNLTVSDIDRTDHIVAVAGIHPYRKALEMGADVIIGGRSSDVAIFAAPAIKAGFPEDLSYYLGKVMECASFCAEPYGAKETIIGTITGEDVKVKAMHPGQRCTIASVAGHAMYERSNPYFEYFAGGMLDMTDCRYEQYDEKTCRITGPKFVPAKELRIKIEGAGRAGERYIGIAGIRDPYSIRNIDRVIDWCRQQVEEQFAGEKYELYFHVFGKNGVMGEWEPVKDIKSHELCVVFEGLADTKKLAEEVTYTGRMELFYARLPEVKGTAGSAAFMMHEVIYSGTAYEWTMNHTIPVNDPMELFNVKLTDSDK